MAKSSFIALFIVGKGFKVHTVLLILGKGVAKIQNQSCVINIYPKAECTMVSEAKTRPSYTQCQRDKTRYS